MTTKTMGTINGVNTDAIAQVMEVIKHDPAQGRARFSVTTAWCGNGPACETRVTGWDLGDQHFEKDFTISTDEPTQLFGTNTAPNPQESLMAAANACMLATYLAACSMNGITLECLEIETTGELDLRGFLGVDPTVTPGYEEIDYTVRVKGDGTPQQFEKVQEWVKKTSPNYWNLAEKITMNAHLEVA